EVTTCDLSEVIDGVDFANGVANRFIWTVAHSTKRIPRASIPDYSELAARLQRVIPANTLGRLDFSDDGSAAWEAWVYSLPLEDAGRLGSACGRARPNALRLAVVFAVLDESRGDAVPKIEACHVRAAVAIINRHRATVEWFLNRPKAQVPPTLAPAQKDKMYQRIEKVHAH